MKSVRSLNIPTLKAGLRWLKVGGGGASPAPPAPVLHTLPCAGPPLRPKLAGVPQLSRACCATCLLSQDHLSSQAGRSMQGKLLLSNREHGRGEGKGERCFNNGQGHWKWATALRTKLVHSCHPHRDKQHPSQAPRLVAATVTLEGSRASQGHILLPATNLFLGGGWGGGGSWPGERRGRWMAVQRSQSPLSPLGSLSPST